MTQRKPTRDPGVTRAIIRDLRERYIPAETEAAAQAALARTLRREAPADHFSNEEREQAAEILAAIKHRYPVGHA